MQRPYMNSLIAICLGLPYNYHMQFKPEIHHRRSIRLKNYDYSQTGAYFVTICTKEKECSFGEINKEQMKLSPTGRIANDCLIAIPKHFENAKVDTFVVMPNHVHFIIIMNHDRRGVACNARNVFASSEEQGVACNAPTNNVYSNIAPKQNTFSVIIRSYKSAVTRMCNQNGNLFFWQRNYYEHIIRNEIELEKIREYIVNNPLNWAEDENYIKL